TGKGHAQGAETRRHDAGRYRPLRAQRSLRRRRAALRETPRARPGKGQRQRRRDRDGPPARRHRCDDPRHRARRIGANRARHRPRHPVRRRRDGDRDDHRARLRGTAMANVTLARSGDGVAIITWNMPGHSMNVMNDVSLGEFAAAVEEALSDAETKGVVITSGKPAFIAGADLDWLEALMAGTSGETEAARIRSLFDRFLDLHRLFRRIETAKKPFVAAINGTALGGGFEICLACHRRIATDDPRALFGLPEAKVGLFPGIGGTQRYLRMLGALEALPLLLEGTSLSPAQALARGLVDELAPASELLARAKSWIRSASADAIVKPWDRPGFVVPGADPRTLAGVQAFSAAHALQRAKTYGNYPALDAIQSVVYRGMMVPIDTALRIETKAFVKLALDPRARNMVRTQFINLQRANKLARRSAAVARKRFSRIGVLGAGLMGSGIADVAARAGIDVVLLDVSQETAERGLAQIRRQQQTAVERGRIGEAEARAIVERVRPTADYARIADAELV